MREVVILGSTGSIGTQALEVIDGRRDKFRVVGLAAGGSSLPLLVEQTRAFSPDFVAVNSSAAADELRDALAGLSRQPTLLVGQDAATGLAGIQCDVVLNAITGSAGLLPTLAVLAAGTTLALANKESLVIGGPLVTRAARPGQIVAVDSEHSAFAQALRAGRPHEVRRLILTASGGPFRGRTRESLRNVTAAQALAHPTWKMGRVITINSSTLVNKGLELLEAGLLYDVDLRSIQVVVHPQSVVHSMVEFWDGSTIAQCSPPDMKLPIALGLAWPDRIQDAAKPCDWTRASEWTFEPLDSDVFPAVELARSCGLIGGTAPAVYNAANEVCVDAFCDGRIGFLDIVDTVAAIVTEHVEERAVLSAISQPGAGPAPGIWCDSAHLRVDAVLAADSWARQRATELTGSSAS